MSSSASEVANVATDRGAAVKQTAEEKKGDNQGDVSLKELAALIQAMNARMVALEDTVKKIDVKNEERWAVESEDESPTRAYAARVGRTVGMRVPVTSYRTPAGERTGLFRFGRKPVVETKPETVKPEITQTAGNKATEETDDKKSRLSRNQSRQ